MAPSLKPTKRPIDLTESADRCKQHLDSLREFASDSKTKHKSGKKKVLLEEVITRVTSNIQALKTWTAAIHKGRPTSDEDIKTSINAVFDNIVLRAQDAKKALSHRLGFSVFSSDKSKAAEVARLWKELDEIRETIGYLHNQVKTVLRDTPDQRERRTRISEIGQERPKSYYVFVQAIRQMSEAERRSIRFGTYRLLWEQFPERLDLNGNVGNADDPGDGKVYDQGTIQKAKQVLKAFYDAWSEAAIRANDANPTSPDTLRKVRKIPDMAKICLILRGMKQERLLDCFCEESKDDKHLPLKEETMRTIFGRDDADHAKTFFSEQYRAVCRTWNDGEHIRIAEEEPLPLTLINEYGRGSYGSVTRRQHAFTDTFYACKEQISDEARAHLLREIARLKKLGHRHIVQFVKSYQRGNNYGILLKPAATTDLKKLLIRYRKNGFDYDRDSGDRRRDRIVLKPVLLTVFGCLSRGLAHIHGCNIRHKDIKPANILYEKALGKGQARFLWADFGLSHDFGNSGNSKTTSKSRHRYSPRYAAPEIMEEFEARKARGEIEYEDSDDDDNDDNAPEQSTGGPGSAIGHGRSSDIYSFGIVFLETLSYLVAVGPEPSIPSDFEKCMPGWKNIEGLQAWAKEQIQRLPPQDPLVFLFRISSKMIAHKPGDRPTISDIVRDLKEENEQYFCTTCLRQPEEPTSQAVIAEEQMVEGLENAKRLSENKHNANDHDHGSVQEVDEETPLAEVSQDQIRRSSRSVNGKEPNVKRSSMRSPNREKHRPTSVLRFSENVISINVEETTTHTQSVPLVEP